MTKQWYYVENRQKIGPIAEEDFRSLIVEKDLSAETFVWTKGMSDWQKLRDVTELSTPATPEASTLSVNIDHEKFYFLKQPHTEKLYGPFSLNMLKILHQDGRLDERCALFSLKDKEWLSVTALEYFRRLYGGEIKKISEKINAPDCVWIQRKVGGVFQGIISERNNEEIDIQLADFKGREGELISLKWGEKNIEARIAVIYPGNQKIKIGLNA